MEAEEREKPSNLLEFYVQRDVYVFDQVGRVIGRLDPGVRVVAFPGVGVTIIGGWDCRLVKRGDGERFDDPHCPEKPPLWGYVDESALVARPLMATGITHVNGRPVTGDVASPTNVYPKPLTPPAMPSDWAFGDQLAQTDLSRKLQRAADENGGLRMRLADMERQLREAQTALEDAKSYFGPTAWKKWLAARSKWRR